MDNRLDETLQTELLNATLPTIPAVAIQLLSLGRADHQDIRHLVAIVENDPALSAALLRLANSAAYRRVRAADTVSMAASYLGFAPSRMIALSASLVPSLAGAQPQGFCYKQFWRRALIASACGRGIGRRLFRREVEELALAALLQDIGMLALAQVREPLYEGLDCDGFVHRQAVGAEHRRFGADHAAVGSWLLARWGFPPHLVTAVAASHAVEIAADAERADFNDAVRAAGLLADVSMNAGDPRDRDNAMQAVAGLLGLGRAELFEALQDVADDVAVAESMCGLQVFDDGALQVALEALSVAPPPPGEGLH